jgi:hypothetical protein
MKKLIWLSFDLGIKGDYEGMYRWLDAHKASECGDSTAAFYYEYTGDLKTSLKTDIETAIEIDKKSRIYLIYQAGKTKGSFIIGERKSPPWAGYAPIPGGQTEDVS